MFLIRRHLLLDFTTIFMLSSLTNGQTGNHHHDHHSSTPHTHSSISSDTPGGGWDPPDPISWNPAFSVLPGINLESLEATPTTSQYDSFSPHLTVGGLAREGYFQSQAIVELPHILPIEGYTSISFRTCSYGTILKQIGHESDSLQLDLTEQGHLSLTLKRLGISHSTVIPNLTLNDNKWHRVFLKYQLGVLTLGADNVTREVANTVGENSEFLKVNLWSPEPLVVIGNSFVGCILEGSNTLISSAEARHSLVDWSSCPLPVGKNCSGYGSDPCFSQPCRGHGKCLPDADQFTCDCYDRYSGRTCESDQGPLCYRDENQCQNDGTCQEDLLGNVTFCACPTGFTGHKCQDTVESLCLQNPCENNGTCSMSPFNDRYECSCPAGFTGTHCEDDENYCTFEPCLHGGQCLDRPNGFECDCLETGYQGDICDVNINECLFSQCASRATCFDLYGSYECACPQGFGGNFCDVDLNECVSDPCLNGGICTDLTNAYECLCPEGFVGLMCETNTLLEIVCPTNSILVDGPEGRTCQCAPGFAGVFPNCAPQSLGCASSPCQNGSTCFDEDLGFTCICPLGLRGALCEINEDDCRNVYCENGGSCVDGLNNYTCSCSPGFEGENCQINLDECASNPCVHATNCTDLINDYECDCETRWSGKNCSDEIDVCIPSPCLNNATCINTIDNFRCMCTNGYQGSLCETDIDDCADAPCLNGGSCQDHVGNYSCLCPETHMGTRCQDAFDACAAQPCANRGICTTPHEGSRDYSCQCAEGFEGINCDVNIDDCFSVICIDGKVCFDLVVNYECRCPIGFEGANCLVEIDECQNDPCANGGTCQDNVGNFTCHCTNRFQGATCEEDIDECETLKPCVNGICINKEGSYDCYCKPGFSGDNCTLEFDECLYKPCLNGGLCINQINNYECECAPGFAGKECQIDIDECESQPCQNNGTCIDGINGFTCECVPGFTDFVCGTNIDECESNPCQNEGRCLDGINLYECDCFDTGFKGLHCEVNIDDCDPDPCVHESNCTDLVKDYECSCYEGYTGKNCEEDILECLSSPCQNDGHCYELSNITYYEMGIFQDFSYATAGGFICECQAGFMGEFCEINIDECVSNPCHFGECVDGINAYECQCQPGYEGVHCETEIDECLRYHPCVHGICTDKIADYACECEDLYGGKNCSVELLGCKDQECYNGGTCVPLLFREHVHEYRCDCQPGFTERNCEHATTMSLDGDSFLTLTAPSPANRYTLSLGFRTTLPDVILAVGQGQDNYFTLVLQQGKVKLHSSILNRYNGIYSGSDLNDGDWHTVRMAVNATHAFLSSNNDTSEHPLTASTNDAFFSTTYLGGLAFNLKILAAEPSYTGCFRDVTLNDIDVVPSLLQPHEKSNLVEGCPRVEQCDPNPCNNGGSCVDLWSSFQCNCKRPYLGDTCSMSFTPATFGNEDTRDSLATVDIPEADRLKFRKRVDVSMLVRTRQPSGLIFYLGSPIQSVSDLGSPAKSYVFAELEDGRVVVRLRFGGPEQVFEVPEPRVDDGNPHLLHVDRDEDALLVTINDRLRLNETLSDNGELHPEILYLGGVPNVRRVKRQLGVTITPVQDVFRNFKGIIQDVRLSAGNETKYVELYPLTTIDLFENFDLSIMGSRINASSLTNVLNGTVSDDTCSSNPCLENGTCTVTFNDYECDCPTGFKGKICDELEYCAMHACPAGATCLNLIDGYECLVNATFNGKNSSLVYETDFRGIELPSIYNFSLNYRSKVGGIVMAAGANGASLWVGIGNGSVVIKQTNVTFRETNFASPDLLDGNWHTLGVTLEPSGLRVRLDGIDIINSDLDDGVIVDFDVIVKSSGIQVGSLPEGIQLHSSSSLETNNLLEEDTPPVLEQYFRGCMGDVRAQGILLPFYPETELLNDTAFNTFVRKAELGTTLDCMVCFENECENEGFCSDPSDVFTCSCLSGFDGDVCQVNIDECQDNNCTKGSTCLDEINKYSCLCVPGYEGEFCDTEIDECASDPCENGASCIDHLAEAECVCLEDFIGPTCSELKVKNCSNNQCQNGALCKDVFNLNTAVADDYSCECLFSYEGKDCEFEIDFCSTLDVLCHNEGTCQLTHMEKGWTCVCAPGFTGQNCELPTNECESSPCDNEAPCVDLHLDFECECSIGFNGKTCSVDVDECNDIRNLCHHGNCVNTDGSYVCECNPKYCGRHCYLKDPCFENELNCTNGHCVGDCDEATNETVPICDCFDGWDGEFCTIVISAKALSIIIGVVVGLMVIVAIVGLVVFFMMAKKKRETSGTYSPSKQEYINPRVEMGNMMKPPEERLI